MLTYLKGGTVKRLHVNRQVIAQNRKSGRDDPTITIQTSKGAVRARRAEILGPSTFVQAGPVVSEVDGTVINVIKPLSCGARVWIETRAAVEAIV